ncbi:MAG: transglycosylase SLT domain-containing protein, partial [Treponema socranskii subsp. buccale]
MTRSLRSALVCAVFVFSFASDAATEGLASLDNSVKRPPDAAGAAAEERTSLEASANRTVSDSASLEDELASLPLVQTLDAADADGSPNPPSSDVELPQSVHASNGTPEEVEVKPVVREEMPLSVAYKELDIPGADRPSVQKYRDYYLSEKAVKWLSVVLENGEQYRLYVREKLKERGMPSVLEYLPVVESGYTTNAKSRSGAVGLWQFM